MTFFILTPIFNSFVLQSGGFISHEGQERVKIHESVVCFLELPLIDDNMRIEGADGEGMLPG